MSRSSILYFGLLLFSCITFSIQLKAQPTPVDSVFYRSGEESIRFLREISVRDWLKRKSTDTLLFSMQKGDQLLIQGETNRSLSMSMTDPNGNAIFANTFSGRLNPVELFARVEGSFAFVINNAGLLFDRKYAFQITHIQEHRICTITCAEHTGQSRERLLPQKITTTVSSKSPQTFSNRYQPFDTLTLFIPEKTKLPHIEVRNAQNETIFQMGSQKGPVNLNIPILDTGIVSVHLSKDGIFGRLPTTHELFLGKIRPQLNADSCCVSLRLYPKEKIKVIQDTVASVLSDSLIHLAATRDITRKNKLTFEIDEVDRSMRSPYLRVAVFIDPKKEAESDAIISSLLELKSKNQVEDFFRAFQESRIEKSLKNSIYVDDGISEHLLNTDFQWLIWDSQSPKSLTFRQNNRIMASETRCVVIDYEFKYAEVYQQ